MTEKQHRAILMSIRDIEFKDCGICQDRSVICCGCNRNQYPGNIWSLEYKDHEEWLNCDVYCDDCCEEYFPDADLFTVGIKQ